MAPLVSHRALIDTNILTGRVFAECKDHYCKELGIETSNFQPIHIITIISHSLSEFDRFIEDHASKPELGNLEVFRFYNLWKIFISETVKVICFKFTNKDLTIPK